MLPVGVFSTRHAKAKVMDALVDAVKPAVRDCKTGVA